MKQLVFVAALLGLLSVAGRAEAGSVSYDFIEGTGAPHPGTIGAIVTFASPPASATAGWSTTNNSDVLSFEILDSAIGPVGYYGLLHLEGSTVGSDTGFTIDTGEIIGQMGSIGLQASFNSPLDGSPSRLRVSMGNKPGVFQVASVPEPSSLVLAGIGAIVAAGYGLRRRGRS